MTKTVEIDIRSAEGLKLNRRLLKKKTFAVARIGEKSRPSHLDVSGGSSPTWNCKLEMPMSGTEQFIYIEVLFRTNELKSSSTAMKDYGACSSQAAETGLWRPRSEPPAIDGYGGRIVTGVPVWCVLQRPT
ncbi:hypothetical protein IGI04_037958 [Brassica rapa subsp. trilocularis]|uniref:C2 domain-containing protein n=1 Tax=Brassica rapa subsp. trilocularis TaxID=1813537 RepID=A0ABQ7LLQ8_BRACM|nr:hypothetical protein IGI04_037958 [Brassica rapa subsp. trilocularis]